MDTERTKVEYISYPIDVFVNLIPLPSDQKYHRDLREFRPQLKKDVEHLEVEIMKNGWLSGQSELRVRKHKDTVMLFVKNGKQDASVLTLDSEPVEALEEGNHRRLALKHLKDHFHSKGADLPKHLKPYKDKFIKGEDCVNFPRNVICKIVHAYEVFEGYHHKLEKEHADKTCGRSIPLTLFKSFTYMVKEYEKWLETKPSKVSFESFSNAVNLGVGDYKNLFGFLNIGNEKRLMSLWEEDDMLGRNRITWENFIKVNFPGKDMAEKNNLRKMHLSKLLELHPDVKVSGSVAKKLAEMYAKKEIIYYSQGLSIIKRKAKEKKQPLDNKAIDGTDEKKEDKVIDSDDEDNEDPNDPYARKMYMKSIPGDRQKMRDIWKVKLLKADPNASDALIEKVIFDVSNVTKSDVEIYYRLPKHRRLTVPLKSFGMLNRDPNLNK